MKSVNETIEDFQEAIIHAGGKFFRMNELKEMSVKELLRTFISYKIKISIHTDDSTEQQEFRRTGITTRIIDQCIQELFTKGETMVVDHTNNRVSNNMLWKRLLHRLSFEHNCHLSDLEIDGDMLKLNRSN